MPLPLEDFCEDIIAKAQRGLGIGHKGLIEKTGITPNILKDLQAGLFKPEYAEDLCKIAVALKLNPDCLLAAAKKAWHPSIKAPLELMTFTSPFGGGMTVNAYVVCHLQTKDAVLFDTGTRPTPIIEAIRHRSLNLKAIFLTHAHPDHVESLRHLRRQLEDVPVFIHANEAIRGAEVFAEGFRFSAGSFGVRGLETPGHSPGGTSYVVRGLKVPMAIVGDALFAGSMGGTNTENFEPAKEAIRTQILTLEPHTLLCPGHGPLSTVALEQMHNPFFG